MPPCLRGLNRSDSEGMVAEEFEGRFATGALIHDTFSSSGSVREILYEEFRGPKGWTDFVGRLPPGNVAEQGEFEGPRVEITELTETGSRGVLASVTLWGRGKASGVEASWDCVWHLLIVEDGKVVFGRGFTDKWKPSKPPGSRSRRCRGRTWTWPAKP